MKIWKHLRTELIFLNKVLPDKNALLHFIADTCQTQGVVKNRTSLFDGMKHREDTMSTGIGMGIGLPHTTNHEVDSLTILLIRLADPIDFDAIDGMPVDIVLSLVIPEHETMLHIQILAGISRLCQNNSFIHAVKEAESSRKLLHTIQQLEEHMAFH